MAAKGWSAPFEAPIPLPRGHQLVTLKDAANHITRLRKAEHESPEWQAAIEALIMAAEDLYTKTAPAALRIFGSVGETTFATLSVVKWKSCFSAVSTAFDPERNCITSPALGVWLFNLK
jgi:hypothetical protein